MAWSCLLTIPLPEHGVDKVSMSIPTVCHGAPSACEPLSRSPQKSQSKSLMSGRQECPQTRRQPTPKKDTRRTQKRRQWRDKSRAHIRVTDKHETLYLREDPTTGHAMRQKAILLMSRENGTLACVLSQISRIVTDVSRRKSWAMGFPTDG